MKWPLVYLHPACPVFVHSPQEANVQVTVGFPVLARCLYREGGGGGGLVSRSLMKSRLCLPVSMTTALLQYWAVGWPLHLKAVPSGISGPSRSFPSAAPPLLLLLLLLAAAAHCCTFKSKHHLHLNQGPSSLFKFPRTTGCDLEPEHT